MGLFDAFKKKGSLPAVEVSDEEIVAPADGELIDVTTVSDPVFAQKMMGESVAFTYDADKVTFCAPANGTLSVLFPTGHAFGITMKNGTELLVHIGIDTVSANGDGFKVLKKQGTAVKAGEAIVEADMGRLKKSYDMPVMLIVTNSADHPVQFKEPCSVKRGETVIL